MDFICPDLGTVLGSDFYHQQRRHGKLVERMRKLRLDTTQQRKHGKQDERMNSKRKEAKLHIKLGKQEKISKCQSMKGFVMQDNKIHEVMTVLRSWLIKEKKEFTSEELYTTVSDESVWDRSDFDGVLNDMIQQGRSIEKIDNDNSDTTYKIIYIIDNYTIDDIIDHKINVEVSNVDNLIYTLYIDIFNGSNSPIYLKFWRVDYDDTFKIVSECCSIGQLPYRLLNQDSHSVMVNLEEIKYDKLNAIGFVTGQDVFLKVSDDKINNLLKQKQ